MTGDGGLIFGGCGNPFFSLPIAFVWSEAKGMQALADIVAANGLTVPEGFALTSILAVSVDGTTVLGVALNDKNEQKSFVLRLPAGALGT
jgi:hypothetical protein